MQISLIPQGFDMHIGNSLVICRSLKCFVTYSLKIKKWYIINILKRVLMKILVVGTGAVASVLVKFLSKDKEVKKIVCGTNDLVRAKEFIPKMSKVSLVKLDASIIKQIEKNAKGMNLIINASLPYFNENIMKVALNVGANYQDLCSELKDLKTPEQLKYHQKFTRTNLKALINTGIAPGITNLLAGMANDIFDKIDEIHIRLLEEQKTSEFIFTWSPEIALNVEFTQPALSFQNRKFKLVAPFSGVENYDFPKIGNKYVFNL